MTIELSPNILARVSTTVKRRGCFSRVESSSSSGRWPSTCLYEEHQGIQGLILRACRHLSADSEALEERDNPIGPDLRRIATAAEPDETAHLHALLDGMATSHCLSPRQCAGPHHIRDCRTSAMGAKLMRYDACGEKQPMYCFRRDRHCPRCQYRQSRDWCERKKAAVLPLTYHHLVFTLSDLLKNWIEVHPQDGLLSSFPC